MENKKISVIIPVYNTGEYTRKCVNSIISQTYSNLEIIIINDGSTDNSLEICRMLEKSDNRITVINQENQGAAAARNNGIKKASGYFISFIDSDDWIDENTYEELTKLYEEHKTSCIHIKRKEIYKSHTSSTKHFSTGLINITPENIGKIDVSPCDKLFLAKNIKSKNITFPEGMVCEDHAFCWKYFTNFSDVYFADKVLYNRFNRDNSTSRFNQSPKGLDGFKVAKAIKENLINDDLLEEYSIPFINFVHSAIKLAIKKTDDVNLYQIPVMAFELLEDIDISKFKNKKKLKLIKKAKNKKLNLNFYRNKKKVEFFIKKIIKLISKKEYYQN